MARRGLTWLALVFPAVWLAATLATARGLRVPYQLQEGAVVAVPRLPPLLLRSHSLLLYAAVVLTALLLGLRRRQVRHRGWILAFGGLTLVLVLAELYYLYPGHPQYGPILFGWLLSVPAFLCLCVFTWLYYLSATARRLGWLVVPILITAAPVLPFIFPVRFSGWAAKEISRLRLPDGRTFHLLGNSRGEVFYSEELYVLGEELSQTPFRLRLRVLGQASGPDPDTVLVRPAGRAEYALPRARPLGPGNVGAVNRGLGKLVLSADHQTLLFIHPTWRPVCRDRGWGATSPTTLRGAAPPRKT